MPDFSPGAGLALTALAKPLVSLNCRSADESRALMIGHQIQREPNTPFALSSNDDNTTHVHYHLGARLACRLRRSGKAAQADRY